MRLLTFSFLRNCKFKLYSYQISQRFLNDSGQTQVAPDKTSDSSSSLLEVLPSWPVREEQAVRAAVLRDMRVLPDFVSEPEEAALMAELEPYLRRMRYEFDHWDDAIHGFKETERSKWSPENELILTRLRTVAFDKSCSSSEPLPHVHVLDLAATGHIKPHVDATRFCGDVIAGVCLLSAAVMRLAHAQRPHLALAALLPRRSLYVMSGVARYEFTHAVLGGAESAFRGEAVPRARRVSVICRSRPPPPPHD